MFGIFSPRVDVISSRATGSVERYFWAADGPASGLTADPPVNAWYNEYPVGRIDGLWTIASGTWRNPADGDDRVVIERFNHVGFRWGDLVEGKLLLSTGEVINRSDAHLYRLCDDLAELKPWSMRKR